MSCIHMPSTYAQHMPVAKQYTLQETRLNITSTQDQTDSMSHMPKTFGICVTCAPRLNIFCNNTHLNHITKKNMKEQ